MPALSMIALRRRALGISQAELARRLGRSQPLVCRWEAGERLPGAMDLVELGRELELEPEVLVVGSLSLGRRLRRGRYSHRAFLRALGQQIGDARRGQDVKPLDVLSRTGITPARLRRIELGAEPSPRELHGLAAIGAVSVVTLIRRAQEASEETRRGDR